MCGINGIVSKNNAPQLVENIVIMNETIKHRGPDDEGFTLFDSNYNSTCYWGNDTPENVKNQVHAFSPINSIFNSEIQKQCQPKVLLAHRRLSILDLSAAGHQPQCNQEKNLWITFNGEIYNYLELKAKLLLKNHKFQTNTDTEVVLAAYLEYGEACVNHFNGMWSFSIFDLNRKTLFCSRDPLGVKPFYYFNDDHYFLFSSEIKALKATSFVSTEINEKAYFDYFVMGMHEVEPEGFFKNIFELQPGHSLILNLVTNDFKIHQYFSPTKYSFLETNNSEANLTSILRDAIKIRLRSDVEVGSCLSGGIDSSAIVSFIKQINPNQKLKTFTAGFPDNEIDESKFATRLSNDLKFENYITTPTSDNLIADFKDLIYCQDIPIWSTSTYAQFSVMKLSKQHGIKVLLDGQGSDELFAGYPNHLIAYLNETSSFSHSLSNINDYGQTKSWFLKEKLKHFAILNLNDELLLKFLKFIYPELKYLNQDILHENKERLQLLRNQITCYSSLNNLLSNEIYNGRLKSYLKCEDRCSMWNSIEARTPFADDINLIKYALNLDGKAKIMKYQLKSHLRKACENIVPDYILNRKDKKGYNTPHNQWINFQKDYFKSILSDQSSIYSNNHLINKNFELLFPHDDFDNGRNFKLIVFNMWKTIFKF